MNAWGKPFVKLSLLLGVVVASLGNEKCEDSTIKTRELKRRVQMGAVQAPQISLPQGGKFDFQYVANAQMYNILRKTDAFSTATIDPAKVYDPSGLSQEEAQVFHQCEDVEDEYITANGVHQKTTFTQLAACMIDMPQGIISGNILDFALVGKGGVTLRLSQIPYLQGANFEFQKYELSVSMRVMHPLQRGGIYHGDKKIIASTAKEKYSKDYGVGFNLNFGGFELGPSYYYKSPLRKVVDEALTASINDLKTQWNDSEPWYAMVLRSCDKYIYINAGNASDAGLREGDLLKIQNVNYRWEGQSCRSHLLGSVDYVGGPVGYAKVVSVGDNISAAVVLDRDPQYPYSRDQIIRPGARVYVEKLIEPQVPVKKAQVKRF
jgi:hypothetical protein